MYGKHRFPGRLFIVEGIDGSGKSTQLSLLHKWLESEGYVTFFSEWNSSPLVRDVTRRGSKRNAIIGAGAGAFLGYLTALNIALRDCGGNCNDERFLVGLALVGTPVAGGLIGYHAFARRNELVYRRSAGAFTPADPATRSLATAP